MSHNSTGKWKFRISYCAAWIFRSIFTNRKSVWWEKKNTRTHTVKQIHSSGGRSESIILLIQSENDIRSARFLWNFSKETACILTTGTGDFFMPKSNHLKELLTLGFKSYHSRIVLNLFVSSYHSVESGWKENDEQRSYKTNFPVLM